MGICRSCERETKGGEGKRGVVAGCMVGKYVVMVIVRGFVVRDILCRLSSLLTTHTGGDGDGSHQHNIVINFIDNLQLLNHDRIFRDPITQPSSRTTICGY